MGAGDFSGAENLIVGVGPLLTGVIFGEVGVCDIVTGGEIPLRVEGGVAVEGAQYP